MQAEVLEARSSQVELVRALRKYEEEVETCEGEVTTLRDVLNGNESQKRALQIQVRIRESLLPTTGWRRLIGCLKLQVVFRR